jgi:hypothetical protein
MAKQIVNIGTSPNQGNGDPLRTAFTKINENFTELYTALGLASDVDLNLGAFQFDGSIMSTTDSTAITIDQATTVTSDLTVGGDILPISNLGGNLGSPSQQWKSLYVANQTIFLNNVPLSLNEDNVLTIDGKEIVTSGTDTAFYNLNGTEMSNGDQSHGATARMSLPPNGEDEIPVVILNNYGDVAIQTGTDPGNTYLWTFNRSGDLVIPNGGDIRDLDGNSVLGSYEIDGGNAFTIYTAEILVDGGGA